MKNLFTFFLLLLSVSFFSSNTYSGDKTVLDGVLQVPKASEAPVIDGELDDIWNMVTAHHMVLSEGRPADTVVSFDDHAAFYRFMWDDDNLYFFLQSSDDTVKTIIDVASPWMNDCVEIFFDGGNEKATSYDNNDVQWRWVYGETPEDTGTASNGPGDWAWKKTTSGYNFELVIPREELLSPVDSSELFDITADAEIGFEISNGDLETPASPQTVLHWWTNVATTWNDPSLFGTALLKEAELSGTSLTINYADSAPEIDGVMEDGEGWEAAEELSFVKFEGGPDVYLQDSTFWSWKDHTAYFRTLWDADNFYVFVKVIDDSIKTDINVGSPWLNDCVEIFFDGENEKATSYDNNDVQWRWVYGETPEDTGTAGNGPGNWAWATTDLGYDFELAIPKEELLSPVDSSTLFSLEPDKEIGFEISNGDLETATSPQLVLHWWTNVATTWNNPSLFGTALLAPATAVREKDVTKKVTSYRLDQNYPNPFNPTTKISFSVPEAGLVTIKVYNILGQEVATLLNEEFKSGTFEVDFNGNNLNSGVYFYKMETANISITKKMMLLK